MSITKHEGAVTAGVVTGRVTSTVSTTEEVEPQDGEYEANEAEKLADYLLRENELKLPAHKASLHLEHNPHKANYQTVREFYEELLRTGVIDGSEWVSEEQKSKAIITNELWTLQWYPMTPVGFCVLYAADLAVLLGHARMGTDVVGFPL